MSLTKIEIIYFDYNTNTLDIMINGKRLMVKLDHTTMNCIEDNIKSCIKERTYIEL